MFTHSRQDTGLRPPKHRVPLVPSAVEFFIVHNFGFGGNWRGFTDETRISRNVQTNMMNGVYQDIAYSCAVGLSGASYEYRGWATADGATFGYHGESISCALIMNGATEQPTPEMIAETWRLFRLAQQQFPGIKLLWHASAQQRCKCGSPTACPGPNNLGWLLAGPPDEQGTLIDLEIGQAVVRGYQRILVEMGFDLGNFGPDRDGVDGDWGKVSRDAMKQFQRQLGVEATGEWNSETDIAYTGLQADLHHTAPETCCIET